MLSNREFQRIVWEHWKNNQRELPWRQPGPQGDFDPYEIMVSEIMLQQTQVPRVIIKYQEFLKTFPSLESLASAPLSKVTIAWQGLGYNRRARYLHLSSQIIVNDLKRNFPDTKEALTELPGVGPNTASAILAYAFNKPEVFIETNIRTVFIHYFFKDGQKVSDKEILRLVEKTLPKQNPREWYWALMDLGTFIKKTYGNPNVQSSSYTKQSKFEGSFRQIRGQILRLLTNDSMTQSDIVKAVNDERARQALKTLEKEGMIKKADQHFMLK